MQGKKINLILGCHGHQPVGNFPHVFQMAYDQAYRPFVDVLEEYPAVRFTLHYTGPLFDWFLENQPAFLGRLRDLAQAGRIEIMGGGYYEPLLCAIPERDALTQIERMNLFCEKHFGARPKGMWLTERVWEPHMPRTLRRAGIEYTALDDSHFLCSGLRPDELFGYYVTEDEGETVKVFPILERLRYLVPFHQVFETIDFLREHATEDGMRCAVLHDDSEKFGIWPETYRSVYEKGWLREFFQALTDNRDWIVSTTYSDYMAQVPPQGRTYITCASYHEMMEWAQPVPTQRTMARVLDRLKDDPERAKEDRLFIRGGFWRNFLTKYPESNSMQKKMLRISAKLERLRKKKDPRLEEVERLLHQGQCNCAYWHGVFGGLYLNHLRTAIYERLLEAERAMDQIEHKNARWLNIEATDFDGDGKDEIVVENTHLTLGLAPEDGGTVFEWSLKDKAYNFGNTLTRRDEVYHDALRTGQVMVGEIGEGEHSIHELVRAKEANLENYLVYDPYRRTSLRDHFYAEDVDVDALWTAKAEELGDFATGACSAETASRSVTLRSQARTGDTTLALTKELCFAPGETDVQIRYTIANSGAAALRARFGVEFAVNLLSGNAFDKYYCSENRDMNYAKLGERGRDNQLTHIALRDDWLKLEFALRFAQAADVFRFAIETVSQSEGGQERIYQGSVVIPTWVIALEPGQTAEFSITATARVTE